MLALERINAGYGRAQVLRDLSLSVASGEILCLLGRNGAGKTTALQAAMGLLPLMSGRVLLDGRELSRQPAHQVPRAGLGYVPQGRRLFAGLTVGEHLEIGLRVRIPTAAAREQMREQVLGLFPPAWRSCWSNSGSMRCSRWRIGWPSSRTVAMAKSCPPRPCAPITASWRAMWGCEPERHRRHGLPSKSRCTSLASQ